MKFSNYKKFNTKISKILSTKSCKQVLAFVTAFALLATSMPMADVSKSVGSVISKFTNYIQTKAEETYTGSVTNSPAYNAVTKTYTINDKEALLNLFNSDPQEYSDITILFANTTTFGDVLKDIPYGLGNEQYPFKGTIKANDASSVVLNMDRALFDYLDDSAQLCSITLGRISDEKRTALLAENVTHSTDTQNTWIIEKSTTADELGIENYPFAGVIGKMSNNSKADINFTNTATDNGGSVNADGYAGLICNEMGAGSELTVSVNTNPYDVMGTESAGGIVGKMNSGSKLTINSFTYKACSDGISGSNAGGIVGEADNAVIRLADGVKPSVNGAVTASADYGTAGGIVGLFNFTDANNAFLSELDISNWAEVKPVLGCKKNQANIGSLFGYIKNTTENGTVKLKNSENITINSTFNSSATASGVGGLIGRYDASKIKASLELNNINVKVDKQNNNMNDYGGLIGSVQGSSYAVINSAHVEVYGKRNANNTFGGLIGYAKAGFINISGNVFINCEYMQSKYCGGLIGWLRDDNVLRLSGTTDLSNTNSSTEGEYHCQIVGFRENGLIYALGSGDDDNWKLIRSNSTAMADDVGGWGEVLRFDGTKLKEGSSGVLSFNDTEHKVTINTKGFSGTGVNISSTSDFVRASLISQLNTNNLVTLSGTGNLSRAKMLSATIELNSDVDLSGTGLTGFMRDNGDGDPFTGTFNGNGHKITFATGEKYGTGDVTSNGTIFYHTYNGLFAKTNNAAINKLTVDGSINSKCYTSSSYIGGISAYNTGKLTMENVESNVKVSFGINNISPNVYAGGLVGWTDGTAELSFKNSKSGAEIEYAGSVAGNEKNKYSNSYIGGVIGCSDSSVSGRTITFDNVAIGGKLSNTQKNYNVNIGGLIGEIKAADSGSEQTVSVNNVEIKGLTIEANIGNRVAYDNVQYDGNSGGFLGHGWYKTNVIFGSDASSGLKVSGSTLTIKGDNTYFAGLVYAASGYWKVNDIEFSSNTITGSTGNKFGMLVNKACRVGDKNDNAWYTNADQDALYLELVNGGKYTIGSTSINLPNYFVFDEIAAYSTNDKGAGSNEQGVISIPAVDGTSVTVKMDGEGCNTYQNQTSINGSSWNPNPNTRYYYNLDTIRDNPDNDAEKLLIWSVNQYAASNLKAAYFSKGSLTENGSYDLKGYSYYPVSIGSGTITGTIKFYNKEIEDSEKVSGGDNFSRCTNGSKESHTQHYLMHHGLFYNARYVYIGQFTLSGSIGVSTDNGSGALVCNAITSGIPASKNIVNVIGPITLKDLYVNNQNENLSYSPLLINKIQSNTTVTLKNLTTAKNGDSYNMGGQDYAAASLIGNAGDPTATGIVINFSDIKLDGRKKLDTLSTLDDVYGTTKSIFSKATLLESFQYSDSASAGIYNYTYDEDWGAGNRNVTYGYEVSGSVENKDKQHKYYSSKFYTDPINQNNTDKAYDFTNFLPYVAVSKAMNNADSDSNHELSVNISRAVLDNGCGTYGDPYIVNGDQLTEVARIISTQTISDGWVINYNKNKDFCSGNVHSEYVYNGSAKKFVSDNDTAEISDIVSYLSEAYYKIDGDITLDKDFAGLGGSSEEYGFKGVVIGSSDMPTITNPSQNPLIRNSNGSVVKNLKIKLTNPIVLNAESSSSAENYKFAYDPLNACPAYGAVIGQVFGGDNIIDNVKLDIESTITVSGNKDYLAAVGGYIGMIQYGGVYFRNMETAALGSGLTSKNISAVENENRLYVNPFIGRVINGFAVEEGKNFGSSKNLNNSQKNYIITTLDKNNTNKLYPNKGSKIIEAPDAQSLFVYYAIVSSGAGNCHNVGYNGTIQGTSGKVPDPGYGDNYMTRRAQYTHIAEKTSTGDYTASKEDTSIAEAKKIPEIIADYTQKGDYYEAKWLIGTSFTLKLTGTDYDLSNSGFRGIGELYNVSKTDETLLTVIDGNGKTLKLGTKVSVYAEKSDNYALKGGVGFINTTNKLNNVHDLTLSGSVTMQQLNVNKYVDFYVDNVPVGGLVGKVNQTSSLYMSNISFDGISVTGSKIAGGLVGQNIKPFTVSGCSSKDLSVYGGLQVGGLVGNANSWVTINGYTNNDKSNFIINSIQALANTSQNEEYGAGGLIGFTYGDINISGLNIKSKTNDGFIGHHSKKSVDAPHSGGIIGSSNTSNINISGCSVNIDIFGNNVGGFVGRYYNRSSSSFKISDCDYGEEKKSSNEKYQLLGYTDTGGFVGYCLTTSALSDCSIQNTIIETNAGERFSYALNVGGIIAHDYDWISSSSDNNFKNISIENCEMKFSSAKAGNTIYIGGAIGSIGNGCNGTVNGYNILLNNVTINVDDSVNTKVNKGNIIGNSNNKQLHFTGVSKQGEISCEKDFEGTFNYDKSYIIMADYNGVCVNENENQKLSSAANNAATVSAAKPWVTVNPGLQITSDFLITSDGAALGNAKRIIDEAAAGTDKKAYKNSNIQKYAVDFNEKYASKLSDFYTQAALNDEQKKAIKNFNVLLVDDNSVTAITDMLTEYVSILTNKDMAEDSSANEKQFSFGGAVKSVETMAYSYTDGNFQLLPDSDKSLIYYDKRQLFGTRSGHYDNENDKLKFTLVDISYLDPTGTDKTVYHLQIPVYVKKVLDFSFESKILTGTDYYSGDYINSTVFESFGEPITTYFGYTYYRTAEEWVEAINSGDDMLWNFEKNLYLGNDNGQGTLPDGTMFTLVDKNNGDKSYSAKLSDGNFIRSNGNLKLSGINGFTPISLNELLMQYAYVTASEDTENGMLVRCGKTDATAMAMIGSEIAYFRSYNDTDGDAQKYSISVAKKEGTEVDNKNRIKLWENYYLTIITPENNENKIIKNFVKFYSGVKRLSGKLPTNCVNSDSSDTSYILGNFINQKVTVTPTNPELIGLDNSKINATLKAKITLNENLSDAFIAYNNSGTSVNVTYKMSGGSGVIANKTYNQTIKEPVDYFYVDYPDSIWESLAENPKSGLDFEADVILSYDANGMINQFPTRDPDNTQDNSGIALIGTSNISYSQNNLENSSITLKTQPTDKHYYREEITAADLTYNVPEVITGQAKDSPYNQLGINPSDADIDSYSITAIGNYDLRDLIKRKDAEKIRFRLELMQKNNEGNYNLVNISDHLDDIQLFGEDGKEIKTDSEGNYIYTVDYNGEDEYDVTTKFTVKTGTEFEGNNYFYANYRVVLKAELLVRENGSEAVMSGSPASDYIVYTNARIHKEFIS